MESQPQNPELRNNPENFHPCICVTSLFKHTYVLSYIVGPEAIIYIPTLCMRAGKTFAISNKISRAGSLGQNFFIS